MVLTFDEAIEHFKNNTDISGTAVFLDDVEDTLKELRDEYAPTVEMTEMQMKQMMSFKEVNAGFSTFMYKQGLGQVPAFSDFITTKREDELMQAWLHPETIKVVE